MGLISSRFMTAEQKQRCCYNDLTLDILNYVLHTAEGLRIGKVDDILMDDESFTIRYLIVDTSTAAIMLNQPRLLLPASICCADAKGRTVRSRANAEQVRSAPAYDAAVELTQSYESTVFTNFGERPFAPADT